MKNKYGFLGLISLVGLLGLQSDSRIFLAWFGFAAFFQYFWTIPDEFFVQTLRRCAAAGFFVQLGVMATVTALFRLRGVCGAGAMNAGVAWGFTVGLCVFVFSTTILEWRQRLSGTTADD